MNIIYNDDDYFGVCAQIMGEENSETIEFFLLQLLFCTSDEKTLSGVCSWIVELERASNEGIDLLYHFARRYNDEWDPDTADPYVTHISMQIHVFHSNLCPHGLDESEELRLSKFKQYLKTVKTICQLYQSCNISGKSHCNAGDFGQITRSTIALTPK